MLQRLFYEFDGVGTLFLQDFCHQYGLYEVSSKTNATDLLKTKRFKLESYFLQHKVSLIFH
jgi:hypothetical protein